MYNNIASFTKDKNAVKQFTTWYDGTPFCNGRGQRFDAVFIDMRLPKEVITNIIIPSCRFCEEGKIFILNEDRKGFTRMGIEDVIKMSI